MSFLEKRSALVLLSICLILGAFFAFLSKNLLLPFLAFLGIAGFISFFYAPRLTFFAVLFLRIELDLLWWLPYSLGSINILAAFTGGITVLGTILAIIRFRNDIERHPSIHYFLALIVLLVFGAIRAYNTSIMIDEFFRIYSPILIVFLTTSLFNKKGDWYRLFLLFLLASLIPIAISTFHLFTGQMSKIQIDGVRRLLGGYQNLRNHALMMLIFSCCGVYFFFQFKKTWQKLASGMYCFTTLFFIYLTQTRATLIVFALFVFLFLYLTKRRTFLFMGIAGVFLAVLLNPSVLQRFSEFSHFFTQIFDNSPHEVDYSSLGSGRFGLWSNSMEAYLDHSLPEILLGLGFGYHWILTRGAYSGFALVQGGFVDTHNDMLRILYQIGPFGLLLFLALLYHGAKTAYWVHKKALLTEQREAGALLVSLSIAIVVNNILSSGINSRTTFGWCFWALIAISYIIKREVLNERFAQAQNQKDDLLSAAQSTIGWNEKMQETPPSPSAVESQVYILPIGRID